MMNIKELIAKLRRLEFDAGFCEGYNHEPDRQTKYEADVVEKEIIACVEAQQDRIAELEKILSEVEVE
jgi:hypothetical protein